MTANSTATRELTIDRIVLRAYQRCGLKNAKEVPNASEYEMGRDLLEEIVDGLQVEGPMVRARDFYTLQLVASQASYELPADTLNLISDGAYLGASATTGRTVVKPVDQETYNRLADHVTEAAPRLYYLNRGATLTVYLWPVPDEAGTIEFSRQRLYGDMDDGNATPDLERHWVKYLVYELAAALAESNSMPVQRCGYLHSRAEAHMKKAKAFGGQRPPIQMVIDHRSGWRR